MPIPRRGFTIHTGLELPPYSSGICTHLPLQSPPYQELPGLPEARVGEDAGRNAIPPATYNFRLYSGKTLELYGRNLYRLDDKLCEGAYTGDDFCDVSWYHIVPYRVETLCFSFVED